MLLYSSPEEHNDFFDLIEKEFHIYMNNLYGMIFRSSLSKEESIMIHFDYILRNEYSTYLDYIFFEELYEFMAIEYDDPLINDGNNINNIIYHDPDNNDFEEDDIYQNADNNDFEEDDIYQNVNNDFEEDDIYS